jgi:NADH dehydrogenase [ubiquinone] 1 alpha subcomplex assembly factor 7
MALSQRVAALLRSASSPERAQAIEDAAARLIDPNGMGAEYKILGVVGKTTVAGPQDSEVIGEVYPFDGKADVDLAVGAGKVHE